MHQGQTLHDDRQASKLAAEHQWLGFTSSMTTSREIEPSHFVFDPRLKPHLAWNARKKAVFAQAHILSC